LLKRAGYRYVLAPVDDSGNGPTGQAMLSHPLEWNMTVIARSGNEVLFVCGEKLSVFSFRLGSGDTRRAGSLRLILVVAGFVYIWLAFG